MVTMTGGYRHYKYDEDTDTIKLMGHTDLIKMTRGYRHFKNYWMIQTL